MPVTGYLVKDKKVTVKLDVSEFIGHLLISSNICLQLVKVCHKIYLGNVSKIEKHKFVSVMVLKVVCNTSRNSDTIPSH